MGDLLSLEMGGSPRVVSPLRVHLRAAPVGAHIEGCFAFAHALKVDRQLLYFDEFVRLVACLRDKEVESVVPKHLVTVRDSTEQRPRSIPPRAQHGHRQNSFS